MGTMNETFNYTHDSEQRKINNENHAVNNTSQLLIPDFDGFNCRLQSFSMPSLSIPKVETPYMGNNTSVPGDTVIYGDLICEMIVDENLDNYTSLVEWIKLTAHNNDVWARTVDITIIWKTRNLHQLREIVFHNAYITDVGELTTLHANQDADGLICSLTFAYEYMTIGELKYQGETT